MKFGAFLLALTPLTMNAFADEAADEEADAAFEKNSKAIKAGLSEDALAKLMGPPKETISAKGEMNPDVSQLRKMKADGGRTYLKPDHSIWTYLLVGLKNKKVVGTVMCEEGGTSAVFTECGPVKKYWLDQAKERP